METVRLGPTEAEPKAQLAMPCRFIFRSWIIRHIKSGDADRTRSPRDLHETVEHDCRRFDDVTAGASTLGLEADAIDPTVYLGFPQHIGHQFAEPIMFCEVDRLETDLLSVGESGLIQVADQHDSRAENTCRRGRSKTHGSCAGDVHRRATADLDDLAGDLMPQDHANRGRGTATNYVLVRAADVCRDDLEYDPVIDRFSCGIAEARKIDVSDFDLAGPQVDDATIGRHLEPPFLSSHMAS